MRVGMEASGHAALVRAPVRGAEVRAVDGRRGQDQAKRVRKQKTDRLDAQQRLRLVNGKLSIRSRMGLGNSKSKHVSPYPADKATHKRAPRPETPAPTPLNPGVAVLPSSPSTPQS